jgi:PAS domain S-box-containing protein
MMKPYSPTSNQYLLPFTVAISLLVAASGLIIMIGWQRNILPLLTFGLGYVPLKANLALSFLLTGIALVLLQFPRRSTLILSQAISVIVFLIGILTVIEFVFRIDLGFHKLLYRHSTLAAVTGETGRMALNSAISLVLISIVQLALSFKKIRFFLFVEFCLVFAFSISFYGLIGFIFGLAGFSQSTGYASMAVITTILFLLTCACLFMIYFRNRPAHLSIDQNLFGGFVFIAFAIVFIAQISITGFNSLRDLGNNLNHTQLVKNQLNLLLNNVIDIETGVRGYYITSKENYLAPMNKAKAELPGTISDLKAYLQDKPVQLARLDTLEKLILERVWYAEILKAGVSENSVSPEKIIPVVDQGKMVTDQIRVLIDRMKNEENQLMVIRNDAEITHAVKAEKILTVNLFIQLLLLTLVYFIIRKSISLRNQAISDLNFLNQTLELKVEERTALLSRNEERLRTTLDNMMEGGQIIGFDWQYTYLNKAAEEQSRRPNKELLGKRFTDVWPGIEDTELYKAIKKCLETRVPSHMENKFYYPDGKTGWFDLRIQPVPEGTFILSLDITERKQADEILHISLAKYITLFDNFPLGITVSDKDGNIVETNSTAEKLLGISAEEQVQRQISGVEWQIIRTDGTPMPAEEYASIRALKEDKKIENIELGIVRPDESIIWLNVTASPIPLDQYGVVVTYGDITDRKKAEARLQMEKEKLDKIATSVPGVIYSFHQSPAGQASMPYASRALKDVVGLDPQDIADDMTPFFSRILPEDAGHVNATITKSAQSMEVWRDVFRFQHPSKGIIWIEGFSAPMRDADMGITWHGLFTDITERKLVEEKLRESEQRFSAAFHDNPTPLIITTVDGKLVEVNKAFCTYIGFSCEGMTGKTAVDLGITDNGSHEDLLDKLSSEGSVQNVEMNIRKPGGDIRTVLGSIEPILLNGIMHRIASIIDITEFKNAEKALSESEEKFRSITENSADAIFLTDSMGRYKYVNKAAIDMIGYSRNELLTKSITDLAPADKSAEYVNLFTELLQKGKLVTEIELLRSDSKEIPVDLNAVMLPGEIIYGSCRDISERKRNQREIERYQNHLEELIEERTDELNLALTEIRDLYEHAPCGYHSLDATGKIIRMNATELTWLGYDKDEVIGIKHISDILTPESREKFLETFPVFKKQGFLNDFELEFTRKDGTIMLVSVNASASTDADGNFLMSRSTLFDITARKEAETALKKARQEAESANKAKSEFLANMSHEIRTPMNAVLGYTELLSKTVIDQIQNDYISSIKSSGRSLLTLINDILDLSKIEAGKFELEYEYIDTRAFFSEFERIFSLKVFEKGLRFVLDITSGAPQGIRIDEARVRQIIFNLIGNAIKFTHEGTITLKVYAEHPQSINHSQDKTDELIDLIIEVSDTGIGISKKFQEFIFKPFAQEKSFKKYGGTGLGLAITTRLLELMNGSIDVTSETGKGSAFTVRIPEISYLRDYITEITDVRIDPSEIIFEEAVILIADDVSYNRSYLKDALKGTNLKVAEAEDGQGALLLAKKLRPDLIITDIMMPEMDGFRLLEKIKSDRKIRHIPVVAYSASVLMEQKERMNSSGFAGLLVKPVDITSLYLTLMKFIPYNTAKKEDTVQALADNIVSGEISDLRGLIASLETTCLEQWKAFSVTQPLDKVRSFAADLVQLGLKHHADLITAYGREMVGAADDFNIDLLLSLIMKYPSILENLRNSGLQKTKE